MEKVNQRRDLQHKLTEAKLQQADALLAEAVEKHKREKEYVSPAALSNRDVFVLKLWPSWLRPLC